MYIRTKDGVYEVDAETDTFYYTNIAREIGVVKTNRVKEADTIEELCDEFVVYFECFNISHYFIYEKSYDELKREAEMLGHSYSVYGGIWTNKGLIYVAKMNNKGDLVLI